MKHLPLMGSMRPLLVILTIYSVFVLVNGPLLMRYRKPFSLKPILIVYNLCMSLANGYFLVRFLQLFNYGLGMFNKFCELPYILFM